MIIYQSKIKPIISVVICTFNRAELIKKAIEGVVNQTIAKDDYEIIVVDNNSQDGTLEILTKYQSNISKPKMVILTEVKQGLGFARNTGVINSQGAYVAFLDDDAVADHKWLELALQLFKNVKPTPLVLGGPILPFYNSAKPSWFQDNYEARTWGDQARFLNFPESFSGSNMIFNKEIIEKCGKFDSKVGMTKDNLSLGEETALFEKIWASSGEVSRMFYSPHLRVFHLVDQYKMTVSYQLKRSFAEGQSWYVRKKPKSFLKKLRIIIVILKSIITHGGRAFSGLARYHNSQNWLVEKVAPLMGNIGILAACCGIYISIKQRET